MDLFLLGHRDSASALAFTRLLWVSRNLEAGGCPVPRQLFPQPDNLAIIDAIGKSLSTASVGS
jgi:hypothetical protein